ncbi:MAG: hypothetical protein NTW19_03115 [Planctomycetota bacterium]|nr:hypothetical protein [Planctomycetota bacterium]
MEIHEAISQVALIRRQLVRSEVFRGYRSSAAAGSGLLALAAAVAQSHGLPDAAAEPGNYVALWAGAAAIAVVTAAGPMLTRARLHESPLMREKTYSALGMLAPSLGAGALITAALLLADPSVLWILPGLWSVLFGLGVFASLAVLPRPMVVVAGHYFVAGAAALYLARGANAFSPWAMALTFGVGQLLTAGVLFWCLEREPDHSHESGFDHQNDGAQS